jgi:Cys-tRNA(Pro)/Cys-tRNA(Cys) deacylase
MIKTNAVRFLNRLGIDYELREYEWIRTICPRKRWQQRSVYHRSRYSRLSPVKGDRNGICLAVISADQELDFKALAKQTGDRKIDMVPLKEEQALTGYIRGGVTALACKKDYPVYIDELAEICDVMSVSAGIRGLQILLAPPDYIRPVKAMVAAIAKAK